MGEGSKACKVEGEKLGKSMARGCGGCATGSCPGLGAEEVRRPERLALAPAPPSRVLPASWSLLPRPGKQATPMLSTHPGSPPMLTSLPPPLPFQALSLRRLPQEPSALFPPHSMPTTLDLPLTLPCPSYSLSPSSTRPSPASLHRSLSITLPFLAPQPPSPQLLPGLLHQAGGDESP